jgi:hypothetical protein
MAHLPHGVFLPVPWHIFISQMAYIEAAATSPNELALSPTRKYRPHRKLLQRAR